MTVVDVCRGGVTRHCLRGGPSRVRSTGVRNKDLEGDSTGASEGFHKLQVEWIRLHRLRPQYRHRECCCKSSGVLKGLDTHARIPGVCTPRVLHTSRLPTSQSHLCVACIIPVRGRRRSVESYCHLLLHTHDNSPFWRTSGLASPS